MITAKDTVPINHTLGEAYDMLTDLYRQLENPAHRLALAEMQDRIADLAFATTLFWHDDEKITFQRLGTLN